MKVYKFGGASIATPERMEAMVPIILQESGPLVLVVSALGKTTNALENIVNRVYKGDLVEAIIMLKELEQQHLAYEEVFQTGTIPKRLFPYFLAVAENISASKGMGYDQIYDAIVSAGELFSTLILASLLEKRGLAVQWLDARNLIKTDDTYRDGAVDLQTSKMLVESTIFPALNAGNIVLTQGFIGSTPQGNATTLGREGSDYTAALLASMLGAESVTIWKDVDGFRNADPKQFANTVKIDAISYNEVIEMAFYGAQIIHPKTIKPLQNNNIPLYVKCFLDSSLEGTVIKGEVDAANYPPLIVLKDNQVLVQVTTRDFSFITEDNLSKIYGIFHSLKIKINIIQNAAISFIASIDNREDKISALLPALGRDYKVHTNTGVQILTIRYFNAGIFEELTAGRQILLKQETRKTIQVVMK